MKFKPTPDNNFSWLLCSLVFLLFCSALFRQLELQGVRFLVDVTLIFTMIIAVWSMSPIQSKLTRFKFYLAVLIVGLMIVEIEFAGRLMTAAQLFTFFIFVAITTHLAWRQVMFTGSITQNTIFGAICIYFLIGLLFAFAYLTLELFAPGSMYGLPDVAWQTNLEESIYYSMVTLTTLGYGDVTPAVPLTRFLAYFEATVGIFYTTVLIASLVGLRLAAYQPNGLKEIE